MKITLEINVHTPDGKSMSREEVEAALCEEIEGLGFEVDESSYEVIDVGTMVPKRGKGK